MIKKNPDSRTLSKMTVGLLTALSVGLTPGGLLAYDLSPGQTGPAVQALAFAEPAQPGLLLPARARGGSKRRGGRSFRGGRRAHGGYKAGRRHYRRGRHYSGKHRTRHRRHRHGYHYRPFIRKFRGRVEECYSGRILYPDRYACYHLYGFYLK